MREVYPYGIIDSLQCNFFRYLCIRTVEYLEGIQHLASAVTLAVNNDISQCRGKPKTAGRRTICNPGNLRLCLDLFVDIHFNRFYLPTLRMS